MQSNKNIKELISECDAILITAGAGMGADSGLPDFRGKDGFWKAYPIAKKLGLSFREMANPTWFTTNPHFAWAFYGHRLNLYRNTKPHEGFKLLLDLVKTKQDNYFIFTSNVDGQFQKAGFDKDKICEIHGSIHHLQCTNKCHKDIWDNNESIEVNMDEFEAKTLPLCPKCSKVARPNILMFGDWMWNGSRSSIQEEYYMNWRKQNSNKKIVVIEIGAGKVIPTVRHEGEQLAKHYDHTTLIRINPREYTIDSQIGLSIASGGLEGIKKLMN